MHQAALSASNKEYIEQGIHMFLTSTAFFRPCSALVSSMGVFGSWSHICLSYHDRICTKSPGLSELQCPASPSITARRI